MKENLHSLWDLVWGGPQEFHAVTDGGDVKKLDQKPQVNNKIIKRRGNYKQKTKSAIITAAAYENFQGGGFSEHFESPSWI